jgi:hypothetical protein
MQATGVMKQVFKCILTQAHTNNVYIIFQDIRGHTELMPGQL